MTEQTPTERARENVPGIVSILVTGLWMAALFTGQNWWPAVLLVGYAVVLPLTGLLFGDGADREKWVDGWSNSGTTAVTETDTGTEDEETPLESLRRRYAEGELTDAQFERKLEKLLETETLEDIEKYRERAATQRERERVDDRSAPDRELERDRE